MLSGCIYSFFANMISLSHSYRLKEFIKEQLVSIPTAPTASSIPAPAPPPPQVQPTVPAAVLTDPGALLAGLL